jgi:quinol-cytochrome oxidoreductase complex cytochrome b subunit
MIFTKVLFRLLSFFFLLLHQKIGRKGRMKRLKGGQAAIRTPWYFLYLYAGITSITPS